MESFEEMLEEAKDKYKGNTLITKLLKELNDTLKDKKKLKYALSLDEKVL